jgi:hypothetical protein
MSIADFESVLVRELKALRRQVEAYPDDASLWRSPAGIANPAGTLVLHLCGNLRHFVGKVLGGVEYVRDRDAEFSRRDVPRAELLAEIDATIEAVSAALGTPADARLSARYPMPIGGRMLTTSQFLVHLAAHLAYHLGQVDYHRRLLTEDATTRLPPRRSPPPPGPGRPPPPPPPDPEEFAAKAATISPEVSLLEAIGLDKEEVPGRITPSRGGRKITPPKGTPPTAAA